MKLAPKRLRHWLPWRWVILAALVVGTAAMGFEGFESHYAREGKSKSIPDLIYLTVQLFTMESGAVEGALPDKLNLARFLGPLVSASAVVSAMVGMFTVQLHRVWLRLRGRHVVVCGLGRKGGRLVEHLREAGHAVVIIDPDDQNPQLTHCRELGCYVITGRANDPWNLLEANIRGAKLLVTVAGDDGVNIETAVRAHDIIEESDRRTPLRCITHVSDPNLQNVFRRHDVYTDENDLFELELFNAFETAARVMLREAGAQDVLNHDDGHEKHILIIGLGRLGRAILLRLLKDWQIEQSVGQQLRVTVIDTAATERRAAFDGRYPGLLDVADTTFVVLDINDPDISTGRYFQNTKGHRPPGAVFICLDDDSQSLYAALTVRSLLGGGIPIVVRMSEEAGLATVLGVTQMRDGCISDVKAVGLLDIACSLELILGGTREILAQAIHHGYICDQLAAGHSTDNNPALAPWHRLPDDLKQSNRQQADHIRAKLKLIGCDLTPQPGYPLHLLEFTDEEVEQLAEVEHDRWIDERQAAGWIYGKTKDVDRKINPLLVPWHELPDAAKGYNRDAVRRIPKVLGKADFEIRRRQIALHADQRVIDNRATLQPRRRAA